MPARTTPNPVALLTSWLVLATGLTLLAALLLGPDADRAQLARAQTAVLEARLDWWQRRAEAHAAFLTALHNNDPIILEHLALTELNRIVVGKQLYHDTLRYEPNYTNPQPIVLGHIGQWIDRAAGPLHTPSLTPPREGWLDSLAQTQRAAFAAAAALFILAGLIWNPTPHLTGATVSSAEG
ncbi:hypothetical protein [Mucisphaera sp.]|uniref:hypothetical protein n=1 Tax=Mucisphaera sp. TaxID=2913024 RepID=UPI003D1277EE